MSDTIEDQNFDLKPVFEILEEYKNQKGAIIPILQRTQEVYGYLPKPILKEISKRMRTPLSRIQGVATFYAQFHLKRRGRHLIRVCDGTACHVKGATKLVDMIEENLAVPAGGSSPDYKFSLEIVYCVGSCGLAPVVIVDDRVMGQAEPDKIVRQLKRIED